MIECERSLTLGNEYASVRLTLDETANGPRVRVSTNRDSRTIFLDPAVFELLCYAEPVIFDLLADAARDHETFKELAAIRRRQPILEGFPDVKIVDGKCQR